MANKSMTYIVLATLISAISLAGFSLTSMAGKQAQGSQLQGKSKKAAKKKIKFKSGGVMTWDNVKNEPMSSKRNNLQRKSKAKSKNRAGTSKPEYRYVPVRR